VKFRIISSIFWNTMPHTPLKVNSRFGGTCYLLYAGLELGSFFDPEDGGDMFLRNVC
jgi:hypothetical protein